VIRIVAVEAAEAIRWELRAGWRRGGALLGRARSGATDRRLTIALNARGRDCVARASCRASLTASARSSRSTPLPLSL
jgi:hypothetical protein